MQRCNDATLQRCTKTPTLQLCKMGADKKQGGEAYRKDE